MIDEIVDYKKNLKPEYQQFQLQFKPQMAIQYYGFLHQGKIFNNANLRRAFCYAIDREKLCDFTLKGTGFPAIYGVVPPGTGTYDSKMIKGFSFDPVKAKDYMTKAGFPDGRGLPPITLELNSGGTRNTQFRRPNRFADSAICATHRSDRICKDGFLPVRLGGGLSRRRKFSEFISQQVCTGGFKYENVYQYIPIHKQNI
jgi:hypothetical protein